MSSPQNTGFNYGLSYMGSGAEIRIDYPVSLLRYLFKTCNGYLVNSLRLL